MSFPAYPSYRALSLKWVSRLPAHWTCKPLRYLVECRDGQRIPLNSEERAERAGDVPYWGANAIVAYVDEALFDEELVLLGEDGAPFFDPTRPVAFRSEGPIWPNNHVHVLRPNEPGSASFIVHALNATDFAEYIEGSTRDKLTQGKMLGIPVPWPPEDERTVIVEFLDRETARIDALIEEQQRLIELLKEKRQAVISHAVTKGLDPTAPMKDSGVECLGEVPAHWAVMPLKRLATIRYGIGEPPPYRDDGIPLIRATNVDHGKISYSGLVLIDPSDLPEGRAIWLEDGDIIVVRSGAYTGDSALITTSNLPAIAGFDMVIRPFGCTPEFLSFALLSAYLKNGQIDLERMRAAQPHLNSEELGGCMVALPPRAEQAEILALLERSTRALDSLKTEAEAGVSLLRERRSALISNAVTGKIDVRGAVESYPKREPEPA